MVQDQTDLVTNEIVDFKKLCNDINKIKTIFSNEKYLKMIGFNLEIKVYYTGAPSKLTNIGYLFRKNSAVQRQHFDNQVKEMEFLQSDRWNKRGLIKIVVSLMDIAYLFT